MSPSLLILSLALSNVAEARALYEKAMYDEALAALGPSCDASEQPVACDEVRAFIYIALGREADAAAAFDRMLAREPSGGLSTQVAPKIQRLYDARQKAIAALLTSEVAPLQGGGDEVPVPVKLDPPGDVALLGATLLLRASPDATLQEIPMQNEGGAWVAMVVLEEPEEARYGLELELAAGAELTLGDESSLRPFVITESAGPTSTDDLFESPTASDDDEVGVPSWVWWAAGGVAILGGAVAVWALTSGSGEGDLVVGVTFDGDAP